MHAFCYSGSYKWRWKWFRNTLAVIQHPPFLSSLLCSVSRILPHWGKEVRFQAPTAGVRPWSGGWHLEGICPGGISHLTRLVHLLNCRRIKLCSSKRPLISGQGFSASQSSNNYLLIVFEVQKEVLCRVLKWIQESDGPWPTCRVKIGSWESEVPLEAACA